MLKEDAIEKMAQSMKDPSIGVCGAKLLFPLNSSSTRPAGKVQHVGMAVSIRGDVIHPLIGWSANNPRCCVSRDVFGVTGACFMTRRDLFRKIGGFDTAYGAGTYEEVDFCMRVRNVGKRVFVNCGAQGWHYAGATAEKKGVGFQFK
jgi:GT2 family glycosyltransferase